MTGLKEGSASQPKAVSQPRGQVNPPVVTLTRDSPVGSRTTGVYTGILEAGGLRWGGD